MNAILWAAVAIFVLGIGFSMGFVLRGIMGENMSRPMPLPPISQPPPPPPESGPNA